MKCVGTAWLLGRRCAATVDRKTAVNQLLPLLGTAPARSELFPTGEGKDGTECRRLPKQRGPAGRVPENRRCGFGRVNKCNKNCSRCIWVTAWASRACYMDHAFRPTPMRSEQNMIANMHTTTDGRFLEFNMGDWSMLVGGFMLVGLLVWLI